MYGSDGPGGDSGGPEGLIRSALGALGAPYKDLIRKMALFQRSGGSNSLGTTFLYTSWTSRIRFSGSRSPTQTDHLGPPEIRQKFAYIVRLGSVGTCYYCPIIISRLKFLRSPSSSCQAVVNSGQGPCATHGFRWVFHCLPSHFLVLAIPQGFQSSSRAM